jgi:protein-disulfide isomerase-like protein with CxxC motif
MNAYEAISHRMVNAENAMIDTIMTIAGVSAADASKALKTLVMVKAIKLDAVGGRYIVKHGAYMDADVLRRAVTYPA